MLMRYVRAASPFAVATCAPLVLFLLSAFLGGAFAWAAVIYMTGFVYLADRLAGTVPGAAEAGAEFPAGARLSVALGAAHFPLMLLSVAAVAGLTGLDGWSRAAHFLAVGLYVGQVGNANAHELIHRDDRRQFTLGKWVFISLLYGHHVTAHRLIHHRYVATPDDPATAALGTGFWAYLPEAWRGAFVAGWEIERSMAEVKGAALPPWRHSYAEYVAGALGILVLVALLLGPGALFAWVAIAAHAQLQIIVSDYVQHYGLRRRSYGDERFEPVAPWHSWNAPQRFSSALMLNATRHSDHHVRPSRPYPELALHGADEAPRLPYSLPVMATIALVPPLWHRLMDRRARAWQARIDAGSLRRRPDLAPRAAPAVPEPEDSDGAGAAVAAVAEAGAEETAALQNKRPDELAPRRQPRDEADVIAGVVSRLQEVPRGPDEKAGAEPKAPDAG